MANWLTQFCPALFRHTPWRPTARSPTLPDHFWGTKMTPEKVFRRKSVRQFHFCFYLVDGWSFYKNLLQKIHHAYTVKWKTYRVLSIFTLAAFVIPSRIFPKTLKKTVQSLLNQVILILLFSYPKKIIHNFPLHSFSQCLCQKFVYIGVARCKSAHLVWLFVSCRSAFIVSGCVFSCALHLCFLTWCAPNTPAPVTVYLCVCVCIWRDSQWNVVSRRVTVSRDKKNWFSDIFLPLFDGLFRHFSRIFCHKFHHKVPLETLWSSSIDFGEGKA